MKTLFNNDIYDTPKENKRVILDKLLMGTRWYFVGGYVNEIIKARTLALKEAYTTEQWVKSSYNVFKLIEKCGGRVHLRGLDNIKAGQGPVVFISNHMSTLETFVFPCLIAPHKEVTFVVKESLVKHPLFGPVMRSRNPIVVGRSNPREDLQTVMKKGQKLLAGGTSVIIFPQSTRTPDFEPEQFNSLGIKVAKTAGVQVVPVAIKTDFWENGAILKDVGPVNRSNDVYMSFGEPFTIEGNGKAEHHRVVDFISQHLAQWKP